MKTIKSTGHEYAYQVAEFASTYKVLQQGPKKKITSAQDAFDALVMHYENCLHTQEQFWALFTNRAGYVIAVSCIGQGGVSSCLMDVKILAKRAIDCGASNVILSHNHPSGNPKPSGADLELTKRVVEGLKLLDIQVQDHLILYPDDNGTAIYYSMCQENESYLF